MPVLNGSLIGTENIGVIVLSTEARLFETKCLLVQVTAEADINTCVIPHLTDQ
jgi:hypothetical protein